MSDHIPNWVARPADRPLAAVALGFGVLAWLVPLVVSSVIVGVTSIGDPRELGRLGLWTVIYYVATMLIAVVLGVFLVTSIRPGEQLEAAFRDSQVEEFEKTEGVVQQRAREASGKGLLGALENIVKQLIPTNPLAAAAGGQLLQPSEV